MRGTASKAERVVARPYRSTRADLNFEIFLEQARRAADTNEDGPLPDWRNVAPGASAPAAWEFHDVVGQIRDVTALPSYISVDALDDLYAEEDRAAATFGAPARSEGVIAAELGLNRELSPEDLSKIRRDYALAHHPDRAPPMEREAATWRMMVANMLIDQALGKKRQSA